jgi:hypothetical protein
MQVDARIFLNPTGVFRWLPVVSFFLRRVVKSVSLRRLGFRFAILEIFHKLKAYGQPKSQIVNLMKTK